MSDQSDSEMDYYEEDDFCESDGEEYSGFEIEEDPEDQACFEKQVSTFDGSHSSQVKQCEDQDDEDFEVLTIEQIFKYMTDSIKEVNVIVQLRATITRLLLAHFKWDNIMLMESYCEDQDKLFSDKKIAKFFKSEMSIGDCSSSDSEIKSNQSMAVYCEICYLSVPSNMMTGFRCGHNFCRSCWNEYLKENIVGKGMCEMISCAAHRCEVLIDDETVMSLLEDSDVKVKYQQLIANSFVECNRSLRWCPSPNCNYAIRIKSFGVKPIKCKCDKVLCCCCGESWHEPMQCTLLKKWLKRCSDDSETSNWIATHTKECPVCKATIEKNGGCNHIFCKKCQNHFCWVCLGPWDVHTSSYNCNRYNEEDSKKARDAQEISREALTRYLFYYNWYMNHLQSLKLEHRLYDSVAEKMNEMQLRGITWVSVQFLKKAVDTLCQCRGILMYSYSFAFYLAKSNQSTIFENNQRDLQMATEQLSEYLERDITKDNFDEIRRNVQDKYRYCENRRLALISHAQEGYDNNLWLYRDGL